MKWSEIPAGARHYMLYHAIVSPLLITWYMLPLYLFKTGYSILEVGILYTAVHVASVPATYLVGRLFDKVPIRHGLVLIDALDGVSSVFYGVAYGPIAPVLLFLGLLIEDISKIFYPLYQAAERILYPEERMEEAFAWHLRLPEITQLFSFLLLGYLFGYIYTSVTNLRIGFIAIGLSSVFTILYILKFIPKMGKEERIEAGTFTFRIDKEFKLILLLEALITLAWSMAPEIVLLNYVVNVLGMTLFEVMLVEAAVSVGAITATYLTERIPKDEGFKAMATGYILIALWAAIMMINPPIMLVILAYFIGRFGDILAFPFYRTWIFSKIPKEKASSLLSALSSYRKIVALLTPAIAGYLASLKPTLPYLLSLILFITVSALLLYKRRIR
ncbi:MAG: MFS transporter [Thermoprotei archaeon]|nr:MAG: MFS transporter [Thermoprotei archaeon]